MLAPSNSEVMPFALSGGAALWDLLEKRCALSELVSTLTRDGVTDQVEGIPLLRLLEDLHRAGVIDRSES